MNPDRYWESLLSSADFLRETWGGAPPSAIVLGSGLGEVVEALPGPELSYTQVPHFRASGVVGHAGRLKLVEREGGHFCALRGRVHLYEGVAVQEVVRAVRTLALWGCRNFLITNAAGGIAEGLSPGDLMLISDHINLQGRNPLTGPNLDQLGERFPDMTHAYHPELAALARRCAEDLQITLREGVYIGLAGPSFETPAEIRMCRALGADAVGFSTVAEVIALNHMRRRVLGISCISNLAAGMLDQPLTHEEVMATTARSQKTLARLLLEILSRLDSKS